MEHYSHTNFTVYSLFQRAKFSSEASIKLEASSFNSGLSFGKYKSMWNCMSFLWELHTVLWFPLNHQKGRNGNCQNMNVEL